uniref:Cytochrome b n=1 Tax=Gari togata TaxID=2774046 RepID=A0A8K0Z4K7_9BIVA|nr:cytochrome b [Gari togata]
MYSLQGRSKVLNALSSSFYNLPCPVNLSFWWNFGSAMGVILVVQIVSGLVLACHYTASVGEAYSSVVHILHDVNFGWFFRSLHSNGASFFFICVYCHMGRGIYYHSFYMHKVWTMGVFMYLSLMTIAFLGYVLPWGQMSYWGATVITNLFSAVPLVGNILTEWLWGGFTVCDATLKRFYILHMFLPFALGGMSVTHLYFLHESGSGNPLGVEDSADLVPFHPYYSFKDFVGVLFIVGWLLVVVFFFPDLFGSVENFIPANPYKTPVHIQPEWYFLFAYAILRSVPSKGGGVAALACSVLILLVLPFRPKYFHLGLAFYPLSQLAFWWFVGSLVILTFIGMRPVEWPYYEVGQWATCVYFSYFMFSWSLELMWDKVMSYVQFSSPLKNWGFLGTPPYYFFYDGMKDLGWEDL